MITNAVNFQQRNHPSVNSRYHAGLPKEQAFKLADNLAVAAFLVFDFVEGFKRALFARADHAAYQLVQCVKLGVLYIRVTQSDKSIVDWYRISSKWPVLLENYRYSINS